MATVKYYRHSLLLSSDAEAKLQAFCALGPHSQSIVVEFLLQLMTLETFEKISMTQPLPRRRVGRSKKRFHT